MQLFECPKCHTPLFFENLSCENCGCEIAFSTNPPKVRAIGRSVKRCGNREVLDCNGIAVGGKRPESAFCNACNYNHAVPDQSVIGNQQLWKNLEYAKRRMLYSLDRFKILPPNKKQQAETGLAFDFLATDAEGTQVLTGHAQGLITINIAEASDSERVNRREQMSERYRTLLGHFRHEVGHYYWDRLIWDTEYLTTCRGLFGDETLDYAVALERHYETGAPADWQQNFISTYASSHPWEDWAETFAHYLHMVDTLETASNYGISLSPVIRSDAMNSEPLKAPYSESNFQQILDRWLPVSVALNSLNRSMGHPDAYPFVLQPPIVEKLRFVHEVLNNR